MAREIGFIGLGQMGKWMAANLVEAGHHVTVFNRSRRPARLLEEQGARVASSPADAGANAEIVFLSLPDAGVVESVLFGDSGVASGAQGGSTIVDLSTTSYVRTLEIARRLEGQHLRFADAPVSGMEARAKDGTLTIMAGCDDALFADLHPALLHMGKTILHMGPVGSGQLTKLVNQLLFNASMAAMAEVLPMAAKLGLDPEKVVQVITTGTGRSFGAEFFAPRILEDQFTEGYPLEKAYKDMISASELSAHQKVPLPIAQATTTVFQMALAQGLGPEDKGALIKVFERILGVEFRRTARKEL